MIEVLYIKDWIKLRTSDELEDGDKAYIVLDGRDYWFEKDQDEWKAPANCCFLAAGET